MNKPKKKFNWRSFTSLYITLSFMIMIVSGIILFLAPPGRIAHWTYWAILGLTKTEWQSIHIIFTFLFILAGSFHIYFNWKPLMHYIKTKRQVTTKVRTELILAITSSILVFVLTLNNVPPFSTVLNFGEELTKSWEDDYASPPVSHAEKLTLLEFSKTLNIPINKIIQNLNSADISYASEELILEELAMENDLTPNDIYKIIQNNIGNKSQSIQSGRGYGRKSMEDVCKEINIDPEEGLAILNSKNIIAKKSDKLKDIATEHKLLPMDIFNILINQQK